MRFSETLDASVEAATALHPSRFEVLKQMSRHEVLDLILLFHFHFLSFLIDRMPALQNQCTTTKGKHDVY